MTTQGVSTKLTMGIICIQALVQMSQDATPKAKIAFGVMVVVVGIAFKVAQVLSGRLNNLNKRNEENGQ